MPEAIAAVIRWYSRQVGGLVLMGDTGCGKTHIAKVVTTAAGGTAWMPAPDGRRVRNAVLYNEPNLLADIRASYGDGGREADRIISACQWARWLIIDDIGAAYVKAESAGWYEDLLWRIFDVRAENLLPMLLTTNLTPPELKAKLGRRAWSRLQGMARPENFINMFGVPDYRARYW